MECQTITLPHGLWVADACLRDATVRPVTADDALGVQELGPHASPAARAHHLLARCTTRLGPQTPVEPETVRDLVAGDREALLLALRRATFGDPLQAHAPCPACGQMLELDLRTSDLLLPPYPDPAPWYDLPPTEPGPARRFRLPTGRDLEAAAPRAGGDPDDAAGMLLLRCLAPDPEDPTGTTTLSPETRERIAARMAELDPQAELRLQTTCPACGESVATLFDAGSFLLAEVDRLAGDLLAEVHLLARHYHWTERDILGLSPARRQAYLDLVRSEQAVSGTP